MTPQGPHPQMASSLIPALAVTAPDADFAPAPVTDREHGGLPHALAAVPDPRDPRGIRYPLVGLLTVAVCAVLAGASSFAAISDWLHDLDEHAPARLGFGRRMPAGTTVWRLLTRLDAGLLTQVLAGWLRTRTPPVPSRPRCYRTVIAVDGKTLRLRHEVVVRREAPSLPGGVKDPPLVCRSRLVKLRAVVRREVARIE
ncbi:transposase family protein [Dactylosporangium sp. CA-092794]|uniref:transposase family protein n=1 Tax=Dactylosporangium sp. CA-092794 TaxID=3239929 RepID=UPI003D931539